MRWQWSGCRLGFQLDGLGVKADVVLLQNKACLQHQGIIGLENSLGGGKKAAETDGRGVGAETRIQRELEQNDEVDEDHRREAVTEGSRRDATDAPLRHCATRATTRRENQRAKERSIQVDGCSRKISLHNIVHI